jgi:hypothetical protein
MTVPMKLTRLTALLLGSACATSAKAPTAATASPTPTPPGVTATAAADAASMVDRDAARDELLDKPAPDFTASAQDGIPVHLAALRGKPVVVYFYPKDETPGCTKEACSFRDAWQAIAKSGAVLIGISADSRESHRDFRSALQSAISASLRRRWLDWRVVRRAVRGSSQATDHRHRGGRDRAKGLPHGQRLRARRANLGRPARGRARPLKGEVDRMTPCWPAWAAFGIPLGVDRYRTLLASLVIGAAIVASSSIMARAAVRASIRSRSPYPPFARPSFIHTTRTGASSPKRRLRIRWSKPLT